MASTPSVDDRRQLGAFGEAAVAHWYRRRGAAILGRNWRVREGEIDIIVAEPRPVDVLSRVSSPSSSTIVFVEVKTRRSSRFGSPAEAITPAKARRLRRLTGLWLDANRGVRYAAVRIDVASVMIDAAGHPTIEVITLDS